MSTPKLWGGRTLGDRSANRREVILAAAEELLGEGGAHAVTMRAVVRTANLSPRYFYESFDSREQLLIAIYDKIENDLFDALGGVDTAGDARATVRSACEILLDFFAEDPRRARILLREPLADDTLRQHSANRIPTFVCAALPLLGDHARTLTSTARGGAAHWAIKTIALSGALVAVYLEYIDGRIEVSQGEIVDDAVELVFAIAQLIESTPSRRYSGQAAHPPSGGGDW